MTDLSSIIVEYFVTGKPIIFCKTEHDQQEYLDFFKRILDISYVVNNQQELYEALEMMRKGEDPKKEERLQLVNELFGPDIGHVAKRIIKEIEKDFYH